jgi:hypothetical protein
VSFYRVVRTVAEARELVKRHGATHLVSRRKREAYVNKPKRGGETVTILPSVWGKLVKELMETGYGEPDSDTKTHHYIYRKKKESHGKATTGG